MKHSAIFKKLITEGRYSIDPQASAAGLKAALEFLPFALATADFTAIAIAFEFWSLNRILHLDLWLMAVWVISALWILMVVIDERSARPVTFATHSKNMAFAFVYTALFGGMTYVLFPMAVDIQMVFLGTIMVAMLSAGAFVFGTAPRVAMVWIGVLGGVSCLTLLSIFNIHLAANVITLILFIGLVCYTVVYMAQLFQERFLSQLEIEEQRDVIRLLLRDFEENSGDWLWETDSDGILRHASIRMEQTVGNIADRLVGRSLLELILSTYPAQDLARESTRMEWEKRFRQLTPFEDIPVQIWVKGRLRWWTLTAKPLFNPDGGFTGWRGVGRDITEQQRREEEIHRRANFDSLTGLANRYYLQRQVDQWTRLNNHQSNAIFVMLDLFNFKSINSTQLDFRDAKIAPK